MNTIDTHQLETTTGGMACVPVCYPAPCHPCGPAPYYMPARPQYMQPPGWGWGYAPAAARWQMFGRPWRR